jgi:hypothetical protein
MKIREGEKIPIGYGYAWTNWNSMTYPFTLFFAFYKCFFFSRINLTSQFKPELPQPS